MYECLIKNKKNYWTALTYMNENNIFTLSLHRQVETVFIWKVRCHRQGNRLGVYINATADL